MHFASLLLHCFWKIRLIAVIAITHRSLSSTISQYSDSQKYHACNILINTCNFHWYFNNFLLILSYTFTKCTFKDNSFISQRNHAYIMVSDRSRLDLCTNILQHNTRWGCKFSYLPVDTTVDNFKLLSKLVCRKYKRNVVSIYLTFTKL